MTWRTQLQAGRFRTAAFQVDSHDHGGGRRLAQHEYPLRDEPYVEDLGRKAREYNIECLVIGEGYMAARDALRAALEAQGSGTLVHPWLGTLRVAVVNYRLRESTRDGGMALFSVNFIEAGREAEPDAEADTAGNVGTAATAATTASESKFAAAFGVAGQSQFVGDAAVAQIGKVVSTLRTVSGRIAATTQFISDFSAQLNALGSAAGTLIRTPAVLASQITGVMVSLGGVSTSVTGAINGYKTLWPFGNADTSPGSSTPGLARQSANQSAMNHLVQAGATLQAARLAATVDFTSSTEATNLRQVFADQFDALLSATDDNTLFAALVDAHAAVVRDLTARAAKLPRTRTVSPAATLPALALAQRLYGAATQAGDIVTRNRIRHPGFVPGGVPLEVLTNAA